MKLFGMQFLCIYVACAVVCASKLTRADIDENQRSPLVQTESGAVVGKIETLPLGKSVHVYLGIPYAEPPVGKLRFAAPKPAKPWSETKDATKFGTECQQLAMPIPGWNITESDTYSEDCLFLNVFVPSTIKPDDKLAVMVWIHGGAFSFGSANMYHGGILSTFNDVIVVTLNYRLGVLGFFNVPGTDVKGNYGMLDQVLALKWVQTNIGSFGGDPNKVTILGESAGGVSVSYHLISPLSKGLFHRAIMQSGVSSMPVWGVKITKPIQLEWYAKAVNCSLGPNIAECVRGKDVEDILLAQSTFLRDKYTGPQEIVGPVVDGEFLLDRPENLFKTGKFHDVDVITGFTSNEGGLFAMMKPPDQIKDGMEQEVFESYIKYELVYDRENSKSPIMEDLILFQYTDHANPDDKITIRKAMIDCGGEAMFVAPALLEAKNLAKGGRPPYVYLFDHRVILSPLPDWMGVTHGSDLPFVFGAPFMEIVDPAIKVLVSNFTETEKGLSWHIMKLWTDFAKYGTPNPTESGPPAVTWPKFTEDEQEYLVLDLKPRVERRYKADKVAFWNEMIPKVAEFMKEKEQESEEKPPRNEL